MATAYQLACWQYYWSAEEISRQTTCLREWCSEEMLTSDEGSFLHERRRNARLKAMHNDPGGLCATIDLIHFEIWKLNFSVEDHEANARRPVLSPLQSPPATQLTNIQLPSRMINTPSVRVAFLSTNTFEPSQSNAVPPIARPQISLSKMELAVFRAKTLKREEF
ncbi:hypothetical protein Tcan_05572 [Toxocara canis]|uniref:Uncharacterized protein n=1 Tax=Toxocara canis TaxID=6265 RepID=A0A0B2VXT3_TOXCA|nr:hypothetical protein Tcan_05572 [Toxocara canis]